MFLVLFAVVFNAALLSLIVSFVLEILIKSNSFMLWQIFAGCYSIVMLTCLVAFMPVTYKLMGMFCGWRELNSTELDAFKSCMPDLKCNFKLTEIKYLVINSDEIKVFGYGYTTIVLTTALLSLASRNEISIQIKQGLVGLYYRDNVRNIALILANWVIILLNFTYYYIYLKCSSGVSSCGGSVVIKCLNLILLLFFCPIVFFYWLSDKIIVQLKTYLEQCSKIRIERFMSDTKVLIRPSASHDFSKMMILLIILGSGISYLLYKL